MKHWYNNGKIAKYCNECPEGFQPGRINKRPTKEELANRALISNIVANVDRQTFLNYYFAHSAADVCQVFKIPNKYLLRKILQAFNYDFAKKMPSRFKGKQATRSHESYISAGKKSAETQKKAWQNKSEAAKQAWKSKMSTSHKTEHYKQAKGEANRQIWFARPEAERAEINKKRSDTLKMYLENLSEDDFREWCDKRSFKKYAIGDIYFDSFPELAFYLYNREELHNGIARSKRRLEYEFNGEKHFYLPDFELDGELIEIKGEQLYEHMLIPNTLDAAKYECMKANGVRLIRTAEYQKYIDWFDERGHKKEDFVA